MDKILDRVWLGDWHDGQNLQARKERIINVVLNLAEELDDPTWEGEAYKKVGFKDGEPIPHEKIKEAVEFIHEHMKKKHRILIHCAAGASRAPTILIAYMYECGWDLDDAIMFVRSKRAVVNPNPILLRSLMEYYGINKLEELQILKE